MSESHIEHQAMECTDRYCSQHRDLWRYYEDIIAPKSTYVPPGAENTAVWTGPKLVK